MVTLGGTVLDIAVDSPLVDGALLDVDTIVEPSSFFSGGKITTTH